MSRIHLTGELVRVVSLCGLFGVLAVGQPTLALAQQASDGLTIARRWCASCHIVEPGGKGSDAARPFAQVANDPDFTLDGLRAWLSDPHPPMPSLTLSNEEIDALTAYIVSLRDGD